MQSFSMAGIISNRIVDFDFGELPNSYYVYEALILIMASETKVIWFDIPNASCLSFLFQGLKFNFRYFLE